MKPELICLILIGVIPLAMAQQPVVSAPQKTVSSYMGLHTFPATNQTPAQQQQDELGCYGWAKQDSGFDLSAPVQSSHSAGPKIPHL